MTFRKLILGATLAASCFATSAFAADLASTLKGEWKGNWTVSFNGYSDRMTVLVTDVDGTNVKGETTFFGTATGDQKAPMKTGEIAGNELKVSQADGLTYTLKLSDDGSKLVGKWANGGFDGPIELKKAQ